ncbi:hypothetical protein VaNZ11_015396 [Volvox africanus]|uniref:BZIP domain-containing protein n=1 Tax=Volvox africanus TaxID=51714 RepID=A0ABQ5SLU7_9CHLO|nr:hypothetical protein VaNZ11_015396 [Volvox africanus]
MQTAYHAEALGSGASFLSHAHLVPRPAAGSAYPFGYHAANYTDGANAPHMLLPTGYGGVAPGPYPQISAEAAAAAVVQPQAYALPGFNYASPFTAALTTPLLNAVQSSLVTASSNAATEMQQIMSSPGQPSALWAQENTPSCSDNGFNQVGAAPDPQQHYAGLSASALPPSLQQHQQDPGVAPLGASVPGFLAPGGYGSAVDVWKHLAMVAATGGCQSGAPLQPSYGSGYQLPFIQQQQQHAATAALQMQAAYIQQQQQQQQQQPSAYGAPGPTMASLGAAAAAASLGVAQSPAGHGLPAGLANAPAHVLQLIQQHQQKLQQQQQQHQQPMQAAITPDSLSDPALAAAAATALHLLQLPAGLRALAACGIMPHLLQAQQPQPPQPQAPPGCGPTSAACYGSGLLAALMPPMPPTAYAPCEPLVAAARASMGQLPYQPPAAAPGLLSTQLQLRPAFAVQTAPGAGTYPREAGPELTDPRLQHLQLLQQQQPLLQAQSSQQPPSGQAQPMNMNPSQGFPEQQPHRQQELPQGQQVERPEREICRAQPSSPSATAAAARRESLAGSLSAPSPVDKEPYTETSSPSPTREPSSAPSGQALSAPQPTSAALLILGMQQQQQFQRQQQQQTGTLARGLDSSSPKTSAELQVRAPSRTSLLPPQLGLPPGPQLLHFAGMPLQLPLPHAVLQATACQPVQPASSCPPPAVKGHVGGAPAACTSTSAPPGALETRRRTLADRRERRKESNRESARRCRLRREKDTCELSRRVTAQETANGNMVAQLQRLEQITNMLLDQNNVLEAWLKHIQEAGDGASTAASTILGYVRNLDEQMAAAAAAVHLQADASQGVYLPADAMAAVQEQPQSQTQLEVPSRNAQGLHQRLASSSETAALMAMDEARGEHAGNNVIRIEGSGAGEAMVVRGLVSGHVGVRSARGGHLGSTSADAFHPAMMGGGESSEALRRSSLVGLDDDDEDDEDDEEDEDEQQLSEGEGDDVVDLEDDQM